MAWLLPLLIFFARICDVSIGTVRVIVVIRGHKFMAAVLGFIEVIIWIYAVSAVITNITESLMTVVAYGAGFAVGTLVGMVIEEKLALGHQMIRIVNNNPNIQVTEYLRDRQFTVTEVEASTMHGPAELCFLVVPRKKAPCVVDMIKDQCPRAFITIEDIRSSYHDMGLFPASASRTPLLRRLIKFR